jgi:hypothetical protein
VGGDDLVPLRCLDFGRSTWTGVEGSLTGFVIYRCLTLGPGGFGLIELDSCNELILFICYISSLPFSVFFCETATYREFLVRDSLFKCLENL